MKRPICKSPWLRRLLLGSLLPALFVLGACGKSAETAPAEPPPPPAALRPPPREVPPPAEPESPPAGQPADPKPGG